MDTATTRLLERAAAPAGLGHLDTLPDDGAIRWQAAGAGTSTPIEIGRPRDGTPDVVLVRRMGDTSHAQVYERTVWETLKAGFADGTIT